MARVKRGNISRKKHQKVLAITKGSRGRVSTCYRQAHQAMLHALSHSYVDRRKKKRDFRALWIQRLNAALEMRNVSYSKFMGLIHKANVLLNRKMLAEIAISEPKALDCILETIKV